MSGPSSAAVWVWVFLEEKSNHILGVQRVLLGASMSHRMEEEGERREEGDREEEGGNFEPMAIKAEILGLPAHPSSW